MNQQDNKFLNTARAALLADMTAPNFAYYVRTNRGPSPYGEVGEHPVYLREDIERWKELLPTLKMKPGRKRAQKRPQ